MPRVFLVLSLSIIPGCSLGFLRGIREAARDGLPVHQNRLAQHKLLEEPAEDPFKADTRPPISYNAYMTPARKAPASASAQRGAELEQRSRLVQLG